MSSNWEDAYTGPNPDEEETPIFTGLYLEYREKAWKRIAEAVGMQARAVPSKEEGTKDEN